MNTYEFPPNKPLDERDINPKELKPHTINPRNTRPPEKIEPIEVSPHTINPQNATPPEKIEPMEVPLPFSNSEPEPPSVHNPEEPIRPITPPITEFYPK